MSDDIKIGPKEDDGSISVQHSTTIKGASRTLNRENCTIETGEITIPVSLVESSIFTGFRSEWLTGTDDDGVEIRLTAGAGMGSSYMQFYRKGVGEFVVDMRECIPIFDQWLLEAAARHPERATRYQDK